MKESAIVRAIITAVRANYPEAWCGKLADRHTRGLPDLVIVFRGYVLFVEVKMPGSKLRPLQAAVASSLRRAGGNFVVASKAADVRNELEKIKYARTV